MTVTAESSLSDVAVPSTERRRAHLPVWLGWSLAVLALLAAAAFVTVAVRSDDADTVAPAHAGIIERGSPVAIDHAAEVDRTGAGAAGAVAPSTGGNHALIIEYGSPTAIDHAAEEARNG
jgi:hypothetical protein